jgi:hypothetical protein
MGGPRLANLPKTKVCEFEPCSTVFAQGNRTNHRWSQTRFCSADCGRRATAKGKAPRPRCARDLHEMVGDNVRIIVRGASSSRSCKACESDRARERNGTAEPAPEPVPTEGPSVSGPGWPVQPPDAPPWRPGGWSAEPNVMGVHR